jgi:hypothetical protein
VMNTFWEPVLSPTGSVVGRRQTGASAQIVGDPHRRIWEQRHDESLEAFKEQVKAAADVAPDYRNAHPARTAPCINRTYF